MLKKDKLIINILVLGLVLLMFIIISLQKRYNAENKKHEAEIKSLEKKLTVISNARLTLQEALRKSIRKKVEFQLSLQYEQERKRVLDEQLKELNSLMSATKSELNNLQTENSTLKKKMGQLEQDKNTLNEQVAYFKKIQENLQRKIKRLLTRTRVELGEVVVTPAALNGKVLKANRKYNFVIVDLGKNDGIKEGMYLTIYKQDNPVGDINIEKVYDELSVGRTIFEWAGGEIDIGDIVKSKS